jgi:tetratricopeptide (TPR) repeat protein
LAVLHAGRDRFLATGQRLGLQRQFGLLADAHARAGHFTEALATLAAVEGACPGEEIHRCETLRRRGELLLKLENAEYRMVNGKLRFPPHPSFSVRHSAEAEDCFREALAVARQQDAQFCALRVAISYARLWQERGKRHEARALLAPIFARFTEGFDTVDLREAKSLLEELTP